MLNIIIMAGGAGSRMGGVEKPLLKICGERILDRMISASLPLGEVTVAVTPARMNTGLRALENGARAIVAPGYGYSIDLEYAVSKTGLPALILPGDLPLVSTASLEWALSLLSRPDKDITTLLVKEGCLPGKRGPLGISLVRGPDWSSYSSVEACPGWDLYDVDTWLDVFRVEERCVE